MFRTYMFFQGSLYAFGLCKYLQVPNTNVFFRLHAKHEQVSLHTLKPIELNALAALPASSNDDFSTSSVPAHTYLE